MKKLVILCLSGMVCFSCTPSKTEKDDQQFATSGDTILVEQNSPIAKKIKIMRVTEELHQTTFATSGVVKAIPTNYAAIASPFSGRIVRSFVRLGQKVRKGSPIFEISSPDFFETGKNYYQAKQEMSLALKSLKREKDLFAHKVGAQKEVEEAEVNYELKKKDYENALAALKVFQIDPEALVLGRPLIVRSPIDGEVVSNNIVMGQYMKDDAEPIALVGDLNKVWVVANVKEKDLSLINALQKVEVELVAMPGKQLPGKIYHVGELLNEETRAVEVLIECDNQSRLMKPGMYGTVMLTGDAVRSILIPTFAILQEKDRQSVLVALGNGRYLRREITTLMTDGDRTVVASGLQPGEEVVTDGAFYFIEVR